MCSDSPLSICFSQVVTTLHDSSEADEAALGSADGGAIASTCATVSHPDEKKEQPYEITINIPIHILSCKATEASSTLPIYTDSAVECPVAPSDHCACMASSNRKRRASDPRSFVEERIVRDSTMSELTDLPPAYDD